LWQARVLGSYRRRPRRGRLRAEGLLVIRVLPEGDHERLGDHVRPVGAAAELLRVQLLLDKGRPEERAAEGKLGRDRKPDNYSSFRMTAGSTRAARAAGVAQAAAATSNIRVFTAANTIGSSGPTSKRSLCR
jgi:hypothetical protein